MDQAAEGGASSGTESGAEQLPISRREVPRLLWRESTGSTNTELVALAADPGLPAFTTLVTTDQTAGRGRLDRSWIAPAGTSLAVSVLVRAPLATEGIGWYPLAAGAAMFDAVTEALPPGASVGIKWPNDVQVDGRKICGILSELVPQNATAPGAAVVIGAGLNLTMTEGQLPVPTATSLLLEGAAATDPAGLIDRVLSAYLHSLTSFVTGLWQAGGDADADVSGLRAAVVRRCNTIGREVRAELPGGGELLGRAVGIDDVGRLEVRTESGEVVAIAAGDVIHLRPTR